MRFLDRREKFRQTQKLTDDPTGYAETWLGHDLWSKQQEILHSVATYPRTAVKACHASGKTLTAADAVLWWITRQQDAIAVTTAPTWTQVEKVLWGEIRSALSGARIKYPKPSATEIRLGPNRYAIGLATNEGVRFQGFHGNVLVVLDEAPGIMPDIWEAIQGIRAGGDVRVLALGNPTLSSGHFYDAFTSAREGWNVITISAFDTPNLQGLTVESLLQLPEEQLDKNVRPYLVRRRWVKEMYREWGAGHPLWEARVLGTFPSQAEDALISLAWLEQAKESEKAASGKVSAGLDVAGPGEDQTVLVIRRGPRIVLLKTWSKADPRGEVVAALAPYKNQFECINVDSAGIGWGMYLHLKDHFGSGVVNAVNVGESPKETEKYFNLKAELYWGLRMRFEVGDVSGLLDEHAIGQLAGIRYKHNPRGQVVIESKEEARKRGVKSPDSAEAVMLAFAERLPVRYPYHEFLKEQQRRLDQENRMPARPESCTQCGATTCITFIQGAGYKCGHCGNQMCKPQPDVRILSRRDVMF